MKSPGTIKREILELNIELAEAELHLAKQEAHDNWEQYSIAAQEVAQVKIRIAKAELQLFDVTESLAVTLPASSAQPTEAAGTGAATPAASQASA